MKDEQHLNEASGMSGTEGVLAPLRGSLLTISLPLGTLLDEVHWHGGNPRAIQSVTPVDDRGTVRTPLRQTQLRLGDPEERRLLETLCSLLWLWPTTPEAG